MIETISNYLRLLLSGSDAGKVYLACCIGLVISFIFLKKQKHYLKVLFAFYLILFCVYFVSIHFYYNYIYEQFAIGGVSHFYFQDAFISNLDTSVFFIIYNLIFIIILLVQLKKKPKRDLNA
jgi:hypothetical protein